MNGSMPNCDLIIPCRDEAAAIPRVLAAVPDGFRPIVVDNGSTDNTADAARRAGADVVSETTPGYGAAVHAGVERCDAEYVAVIDGDASLDPSDLVNLLADVRDGSCTMSVGRRRPSSGTAWPWHAQAGTKLLAWLIRRRSGQPIHDLAPLRVCRREDLLSLNVADRRFGYPLELMLAAARAGWTVRERDVSYGQRAAGTRSKVSGSLRGTTLTMLDFARVWRQDGARLDERPVGGKPQAGEAR